MYEYIHTYIYLLFLLISLIPALSQADPYWVEFLPGYPEGTPPIMTVTYSENKIDIPLESNISSGVYLIRTYDDNNEIIKRFIIR